MKEPNEVFGLLVRHEPADEKDVHPVIVELSCERRVGFEIEMREIWHYWQHRRRRESIALEILPVELRVAQGEIHPRHVRPQLTKPAIALQHQLRMDADVELGRRDV